MLETNQTILRKPILNKRLIWFLNFLTIFQQEAQSKIIKKSLKSQNKQQIIIKKESDNLTNHKEIHRFKLEIVSFKKSQFQDQNKGQNNSESFNLQKILKKYKIKRT